MIAGSLRDENLPIDVLDMPQPSDDELSESERVFVGRLRLGAMSSERLRKYIYLHNRAFAQRSIWRRDRLLERESEALPFRSRLSASGGPNGY